MTERLEDDYMAGYVILASDGGALLRWAQGDDLCYPVFGILKGDITIEEAIAYINDDIQAQNFNARMPRNEQVKITGDSL